MSDKPSHEIIDDLVDRLEKDYLARHPNNKTLVDSYVSGYLQGLISSIIIHSPEAKAHILETIAQYEKKGNEND
jgi:hypothetical protein